MHFSGIFPEINFFHEQKIEITIKVYKKMKNLTWNKKIQMPREYNRVKIEERSAVLKSN